MIALIGSGADHCLTRSLDTGELNSRIIALIRRSRGYVTSCIEIGNLRVDITEGRALRSEIPLDLSPEEYRLIECLVVRRGQSVFVNEIAIEVFGTTLDGQARVEKGVASLLRKLGDDSNPTIKSSGAHGYTICY